MHTLRYYERIGLLHAVQRTTGYRRYSTNDLDWIGLLVCLRETGMSIHQMLQFMQLVQHGETTVPARCDILAAQRNALAQRIARLHVYQGVIDAPKSRHTAGSSSSNTNKARVHHGTRTFGSNWRIGQCVVLGYNALRYNRGRNNVVAVAG